MSILTEAADLCEVKGLKYTIGRGQVLELLSKADKALTAYELLELLKDSQPKAKPPTIYRALEFWIEAGIIHRLDSNNTFVVCEQPGEAHIAQMLICNQCGHVAELCADAIAKQLRIQAQQQNFKVDKLVIETHGFCESCH
jgi:Fur family transcriptional regulator, zinc uptake regulator